MSHAAEYKHCSCLSILKNKRGKGLWQFSQGLPHSDGHRGGPPPLLWGDFFRPQGDSGPGGVGLHYAWPGQPGWRSAWQWGPSAQMSAHTERTLESDGKRRQGGRKKKEKQDLYGKSTLIWPLGHLLKTSCRFDINTDTSICTRM